ncbi:MAG: hypothetical protein HEP71_08555 [Roseivirga sp.]|nr:hypothetical protein [Roseivirga sp.]
MSRVFLISVLSLIAVSVFAQQDSTFMVKGKLLDAETKEPVPLATVLIVNKQTGTSGNNVGEFRLPVNIGDEIKFTSIGYEPVSLMVTEELKASIDKEPLVLFMIPAVYELDSVVVFHIGEDFYLKRKKGEPIEIVGLPKPTGKPRDWSKPQVIVDGGGIGIYGLLNVFDKKLQQQKKVRKLQAAIDYRKKREEQLNAVYNKKIVKRITGIDDRVIDEFMDFCDFTEGELLTYNEYQITARLLNRYHAFLRR